MSAEATPKGAWKITFLLFLFMLVNFADKIVVGLAGVPIMTELKLDPEQFGTLGSSFFVLFSISAIVVGFIVNSVPTRWALLAMWVVRWLVMGKEGSLVQAVVMAAADPRVPYSQLLTSRTFIGCCAATFGAYWALSLGLTWFTPFIVQGLGFSQQDAGWISVLPWVFGAATVLLTGWVSQVMLTKGYTTRGARGVLGAAPLVVGGCILAGPPHVSGAGLQIALLVGGSGLCGSIYVVCPPVLGEFTPVSQTGSVISVYVAID